MSSSVLPLAKIVINTRDIVAAHANKLAQGCAAMLSVGNGRSLVDVVTTLRLFSQEGLLNVHDHAYKTGVVPEAFVVATLTPILSPDERDWDAVSSSAERDWYQHWFGQADMLELAISDYGLSVPATLWPAYRSGHPESANLANIESKAGRIVRSNLQTRILEWAFHHTSSRRLLSNSPPDVSQLNWRGLHRAMNLAAVFSGIVAIRSGQARAGFAFDGGRAIPILPLHPASQNELPGTTLIIRLPIRHGSPRAEGESFSTPYLGKVYDHSKPETFHLSDIITPSQPQKSLVTVNSETIAIVHPLPNILDIKLLLRPWIPPGIVELHVCLECEPSVSNGLQAFAETTHDNLGSPRLLGFIDICGQVTWRLVGLLPQDSRPLVYALEHDHYYSLEGLDSLREYAETLVALYPEYFTISDTILRLDYNYRLSACDYQRALQMAFVSWSQSNSELWVTDNLSLIRLTSGRVVKRHVSVLNMLYASELLRKLLGHRLATLIADIQLHSHKAIVVADEAASYYIARLIGSGFIDEHTRITLPSLRQNL